MHVALKKPQRFYERLIDWLSGARGYCHAELIFTSDVESLTSLAAGGVQWLDRRYPAAEWDVWDVGFEWAEDLVADWADGEIGCKYDYLGVLRFLLKFLRQSPKRWFCSEIVTAALQQCSLFRHLKPWKVSPNKLAKMLEHFGFTRFDRRVASIGRATQ